MNERAFELETTPIVGIGTSRFPDRCGYAETFAHEASAVRVPAAPIAGRSRPRSRRVTTSAALGRRFRPGVVDGRPTPDEVATPPVAVEGPVAELLSVTEEDIFEFTIESLIRGVEALLEGDLTAGEG